MKWDVSGEAEDGSDSNRFLELGPHVCLVSLYLQKMRSS